MSIFKNPQHCQKLLAQIEQERAQALSMVQLVTQAPGPERTLAQKLEKFLRNRFDGWGIIPGLGSGIKIRFAHKIPDGRKGKGQKSFDDAQKTQHGIEQKIARLIVEGEKYTHDDVLGDLQTISLQYAKVVRMGMAGYNLLPDYYHTIWYQMVTGLLHETKDIESNRATLFALAGMDALHDEMHKAAANGRRFEFAQNQQPDPYLNDGKNMGSIKTSAEEVDKYFQKTYSMIFAQALNYGNFSAAEYALGRLQNIHPNNSLNIMRLTPNTGLEIGTSNVLDFMQSPEIVQAMGLTALNIMSDQNQYGFVPGLHEMVRKRIVDLFDEAGQERLVLDHLGRCAFYHIDDNPSEPDADLFGLLVLGLPRDAWERLMAVEGFADTRVGMTVRDNLELSQAVAETANGKETDQAKRKNKI